MDWLGRASRGAGAIGRAAGALWHAVATRMYYLLSIIGTTDKKKERIKKKSFKSKKETKTQERNK